MNAENSTIPLEELQLTEKLINRLYENDLIKADARLLLFEKLYGKKDWGSWISKFSLILGFSLVLSGIIYFFAYNWAQIPHLIKFGIIEISFILSMIIPIFYGLEHLYGKIMRRKDIIYHRIKRNNMENTEYEKVSTKEIIT